MHSYKTWLKYAKSTALIDTALSINVCRNGPRYIKHFTIGPTFNNNGRAHTCSTIVFENLDDFHKTFEILASKIDSFVFFNISSKGNKIALRYCMI